MRLYVQLLVAVALTLASVRPADANGRPPMTFKVAFQPGNLQVMVVGTTFGFLLSEDGGTTWRWGCDSVVGIMGTFDPDYEITPTGLILATSNEGIYMSRDHCTWTKPKDPLGSGTISSISVASDGTIWTTMSDPIGGYKVFKSANDGESFEEVTIGIESDWWDTIEVAPSDPDRIYLTGFVLVDDPVMPKSRLLLRSTDGGTTWEQLPTTAFVGTRHSDLKIAGIDPNDADRVFLRLTLTQTGTVEETLFRTNDGGAPSPTWTEVLRDTDFLSGLAVRTNGDVYVVHTNSLKLSRSIADGPFEQVADTAYQSMCVAERRPDQKLFLCMNNLIGDSIYHLASSTTGDAGSWVGELRFPDIVEPIRCAAGTPQHDDCEVNLWCGQKEQLGITSEAIECTAPVDAGEPVTPPADDGCCGVGGSPGLEVAAPALLLLRRRRRRPAAPTRSSP